MILEGRLGKKLRHVANAVFRKAIKANVHLALAVLEREVALQVALADRGAAPLKGASDLAHVAARRRGGLGFGARSTRALVRARVCGAREALRAVAAGKLFGHRAPVGKRLAVPVGHEVPPQLGQPGGFEPARLAPPPVLHARAPFGVVGGIFQGGETPIAPARAGVRDHVVYTVKM